MTQQPASYAKKPQIPYFCFRDEYARRKREELKAGSKEGEPAPKFDQKDAWRTAKVAWDAMSEEEKAPYYEMARKDRERFEAEIRSGLTTKSGNIPKDLAKELYVTGKRSAFIFFSMDKKDSVPADTKVTERTSIIAKMWKELSEEEKKVYFQMEQDDKARYKREIDAGGKPKPRRVPRRRKTTQQQEVKAKKAAAKAQQRANAVTAPAVSQ